MAEQKTGLRAGWGRADITPDGPVFVAGQFHARISEGVRDPVTATALALESAREGRPGEHAVLVSCDLVSISDELRSAVRDRVGSQIPGLNPEAVILGATHTHAAPLARPERGERYGRKTEAPAENRPPYGVALEAMDPAAYVDFAAERIFAAVREAWEGRGPAGIGYGTGQAVVGRNRRLTYRDGSSAMYGRADTPEFSHVEGYEDHSVYVLMTYDMDGALSGLVVNVPCPSQVSESSFQISADYWHETRMELRRRFGRDLPVLGQCAPAGDQSPHLLVGRRAEERMWRLKGFNPEENAPRAEIARRIADGVSEVVACAGREIDWNPALARHREMLNLPRRRITSGDVQKARAEAEKHREKYEALRAELEQDPGLRAKPRWYVPVTDAYGKMKWSGGTEQRFRLQQEEPEVAMEVQALVLGEVALATNPFELYLDYGTQMREQSRAVQTFLVQLAGPGSYLPSERTLAGGGYGTVPSSTVYGPEGGAQLVAWTVSTINALLETVEQARNKKSS